MEKLIEKLTNRLDTITNQYEDIVLNKEKEIPQDKAAKLPLILQVAKKMYLECEFLVVASILKDDLGVALNDNHLKIYTKLSKSAINNLSITNGKVEPTGDFKNYIDKLKNGNKE